mmetsp:Transcript_77984/g.152574  ORF Transcript_77984/g.152574 Transcript_77984/m.152574 type:complete len:243 (-) Transcript_77984:1222-1950(-)
MPTATFVPGVLISFSAACPRCSTKFCAEPRLPFALSVAVFPLVLNNHVCVLRRRSSNAAVFILAPQRTVSTRHLVLVELKPPPAAGPRTAAELTGARLPTAVWVARASHVCQIFTQLERVGNGVEGNEGIGGGHHAANLVRVKALAARAHDAARAAQVDSPGAVVAAQAGALAAGGRAADGPHVLSAEKAAVAQLLFRGRRFLHFAATRCYRPMLRCRVRFRCRRIGGRQHKRWRWRCNWCR